MAFAEHTTNGGSCSDKLTQLAIGAAVGRHAVTLVLRVSVSGDVTNTVHTSTAVLASTIRKITNILSFSRKSQFVLKNQNVSRQVVVVFFKSKSLKNCGKFASITILQYSRSGCTEVGVTVITSPVLVADT